MFDKLKGRNRLYVCNILGSGHGDPLENSSGCQPTIRHSFAKTPYNKSKEFINLTFSIEKQNSGVLQENYVNHINNAFPIENRSYGIPKELS